MESLAILELFLVNKEIKDLKPIEELNWKKCFSLPYINFLLAVIINSILIDASLARVSEICVPETNSYSDFDVSQPQNNKTAQEQLATNSFFSSSRQESNVVLVSPSQVCLRHGDSAAIVAAVQRKLRELGYFTGNLTGYYGQETEVAVIQFQEDKGLTPTGQIDPTTWSLLILGRKDSKTNSQLFTYPTKVLFLGEVSPQVATLKKRLAELGFYKGRINSIYDQETRTAVIRFQNVYGITSTGQVGYTTWDFLFGRRAIAVKRVLKLGNIGPDVGKLQQRLRSLGYYQGQITNSFDQSTEIAVINFQNTNRITPTGIVGQTTQAFLFDPQQTLPPGPISDSRGNYISSQQSDPSFLKRGHQGWAVKQLQILLAKLGYYPGIIDGFFGPSTEFAVRNFQQDLGLVVSGEATRNTLQLLRAPFMIDQNISEEQFSHINSQTQVLELQNRLRLKGFYTGPLNGVYDSRTRAAVAKAQLIYGVNGKDIGD